MSDGAGNLPTQPSLEPEDFFAGSFGVHVISEFAFCSRAGIIASEQPEPDDESEPQLGPRLDFMRLDERELIEAREHYWQSLVSASAVSLVGLALVLAIKVVLNRWTWTVIGLIPLSAGVSDICFALPLFWQASKALQAFRAAVIPKDFGDPTRTVSVDWWALRKAGWDCQKLKEELQAPDKSMGGKPWRVFVTPENWRIPVIWRPRGSESYGLPQTVRLAAYSRLLEECMNAISPFGVIFYQGTTRCDIVPISPELKSRLGSTLIQARREMGQLRQGSPPAAPTDNRCSGCPFGRPRPRREGKSDTILSGCRFPAITFRGFDERRGHPDDYHSVCGDRFCWTPPHKDTPRQQQFLSGRPTGK